MGRKNKNIDFDQTTAPPGAELRKATAAFAQPITDRAAWQLLTTFAPFVAVCATMYLVFPVSSLFALALALPAGMLLVRIFIIQHDCGHGSFFVSMRANAIVGRLCGLLTLTPYANWARQHGLHHGNWSNLDPAKVATSIRAA